jgi:hypothetical protein
MRYSTRQSWQKSGSSLANRSSQRSTQKQRAKNAIPAVVCSAATATGVVEVFSLWMLVEKGSHQNRNLISLFVESEVAGVLGHIRQFVSKKLPQMLKLMSAQRRTELQIQD